MKSKDGKLTENIALSRNWFRQGYEPEELQLRRQTVYGSTHYQYHEGILLLVVTSGQGVLLVNGLRYEIQPGSCCLLYFFDFYRLISQPDKELNICSCLIPYNTYLLLMTLPSYTLMRLEQADAPILVQFPPKSRARIERLIERMEGSSGIAYCNDQYILLFEWLARLCREFERGSGK